MKPASFSIPTAQHGQPCKPYFSLFYFSTCDQGGEIQGIHVPNKGCGLTIVSAKEAKLGAAELNCYEEVWFWY